jgi:ketosteroid isomerase-like protein
MGETMDLARRLFELYERGATDELLELVDPEVEVRPRGLPGAIYRGHEGVRQMFTEAHGLGRESEVSIDHFVASGERVAVLGRIRVRQRQFLSDSSAAWLLETRLGKLARVVSYRSHANALRAVGDAAVGAPA